MTKTAGQVAYEAYCAVSYNKSLVSGTELPSWDRQYPSIRKAWEIAALSVIRFAAESMEQLPVRP
jgi:hypothetical protein